MVHYVFQVGKYTSLMDIYEKVFVFMAPGSPIITWIMRLQVCFFGGVLEWRDYSR